MKKIFVVVLSLMMVLSLAACSGKTDNASSDKSTSGTETVQQETSDTSDPDTSGEDNKDDENVSVNWKNAEVAEYEAEDFSTLTVGIPEPTTAYKINAISTASGLMFDFESETEAEAWKEMLLDNGFTFLEEKLGTYTYENDTYTIRFSGYSITIKIK